jgi:hypothetical protein
MAKKVLAGSLGDCVHVAGVTRFLRVAEQEGCETFFTGPATDRKLCGCDCGVDPT